jgi:hypothetical protein
MEPQCGSRRAIRSAEMKGGVHVEWTLKHRWALAAATIVIALAVVGLLTGPKDAGNVTRPGGRAVRAAQTERAKAAAASSARDRILDALLASTVQPVEGVVSDLHVADVDQRDGRTSGPDATRRLLTAALPGRDTSYTVGAMDNPAGEQHSVATPRLGVPGTCTERVCRQDTTTPERSAATPDVDSRTAGTGTMDVPGRCTDLVCIGSFTIRPLSASTPRIDGRSVTTSEVRVPAACRTAESACIGETGVGGQTILVVPAVGGRHLTEAVTVEVELAGVELAVGPRLGSSNETGPFVVPVNVPSVGVIDVTVCPEGCVSWRLTEGFTHGALHVAVTHGENTSKATVPIEREW